MATTSPTSQKDMRISFAFLEGDKPVRFTWLAINPEELTRVEPSRTSVVNSLNGAWVDSFGRGVTTLTISGNTGWRDRSKIIGEKRDGLNRFVLLRDQYIHQWHLARRRLIDQGKDPGGVRLLFVDPLNGPYVAEVVPVSFTLRRSKSQPLLLMYNISMQVVNDKAVAPLAKMLEPFIPANDPRASRESMLSSINKIGELQTKLRSTLGSVNALGATVNTWTAKTFGPVMAAARDVIQTAADAKAVINATGKIAIDLARDMSAVGTQLWGAVAAVTSLPNAIKSQVMQIKGEFTNLHCVLSNGYKTAYQAEDYSSFYGASNCSSTLGGRGLSALAGVNPFETTTSLATAKVSDAAAKAIRYIKSIDPVAPVNVPKLQDATKAMNDGVIRA